MPLAGGAFDRFIDFFERKEPWLDDWNQEVDSVAACIIEILSANESNQLRSHIQFLMPVFPLREGQRKETWPLSASVVE